ncbi:MAG: hypothetical protein M0R80_19295 [Proteobacteria bacterium]|jgi:hypothetical protein|nr:hypothetical protein [Pseudomonadota bacterium]
MGAVERETIHFVQAFVAGRGDALAAEPPIGCKSAGEACRKAARLSSTRLGVVAFSVSADTALGEYDEKPTILFKAGRLPAPFDE